MSVFTHNYTGTTLNGRLVNLCAACRENAGSLGFHGIGQTIRSCDECAKKAGWQDASAEAEETEA